MGIINCKYHGKTGIIFACRHISEDLDKRQKLDRVITSIFPDKRDIEKKFKYNLELSYCPICAEKYNFPDENIELPRQEFNLMYNTGEFLPVCFKCFIELSVTNP